MRRWALLSALALLPVAATAQVRFAPAAALRPDQHASLALLGRVWGFAKYHHAGFVTAGADADSALLHRIPRVLAAPSAAAARDSIAAWLDAIGTPPPCASACAAPPASPALAPAIDWIRDTALVGAALAPRLERIHAARPQVDRQHYVAPAATRNPEFTNERAYAPGELDRPEVRVLGVFRLWNILEYWFPYRDLMEPDRVALLRDALPAAWSAERLDDYQRVLIRLVARARDTHANVWNALAARPPVGSYALPVALRMIEGRPVVFAFTNDTLGPRSGLRVGDAILAVDGTAVDSLFRAWTPLYAASNEPTRERDMARGLVRGADSLATLVVDRAGRRTTLRVPRVRYALLDMRAGATHDLPGDTFRMLTPEVAYVKLAPLKRDSVASYLERAKDAKVLVVDNRNYPSDFPIYALGGRLVAAPTPFARFTRADWSNPGAFVWDPQLITMLRPQAPTFAGKVVVLVDEVTQSSAEFHAMAFRTAPGAIVVGSTTAGADGNVSRIPLPGGMQAMITGIGTFYPDGRPTQQIGIVPDVVVRPTLAGFRAGRDEVLEAGVSRALGREFRLQR
jgi:C-terminal processing protease CtpA/Prc